MNTFIKSGLSVQLVHAVCLAVVLAVAGCSDESSGPNIPEFNPLLGNWGVVDVIIDGEPPHHSEGDEGYWVISADKTVCLIEQNSDGSYEFDSTFIYEQDEEFFVARFDLDPIPSPPITMRYWFSAPSDTLYMSWEANEAYQAGAMSLARKDSVPAGCGCSLVLQ